MLQPKKSTTKKPNPIKKYKKTSSGDSALEDVFEIIDPTGISSYDDVYRSYKDNGLFSWQTGLEVLGALPIIGKAGKGIKILNTSSKYLKALSKTNKITAKAEKVIPTVLKYGKNFGETAHKVSRGGKANPIAAAAIATGIGAEGLQKVTKIIEKTTKKGVKEIIKKTPSNKRVINETVATVNSANTLSDVAGAVQNQIISPIKEKIVTPIASDIKEFIDKDSYQPVPKKTVYYNTDPKRGEVEKPGTEEGVQYLPLTNRFDLEKWKKQKEAEKLTYGTNSQGIMKSKMNPRKKYANGSSAKGMNVNNYIISPAEALADYDIMMAKVEQQAMSNPWLPVVAAVGGAAQSFVGNANMYKKGDTGGGGKFEVGGGFDEINKNIDTDAINKFDFSSDNASLNKGVLAAMGMNNVQQDVEVEGGEMYETPQGQVGEFKGPSHEEEGIPLEVTQDPNANIAEGEVQEGTKVYSDRLKIQGKTLAKRKEIREKRIANLEDTASQPLVDQAIKNASKRKMMTIQKEEIADLDFQDKVNNIQQMADTMVAAYGTSLAGLQDNPIGESMRYAGGTGITGIDPITKRAYDSWLYASADELYKKYPKLKQGSLADDINVKKDFQTFLFKDKAGTKDADNNYSIDGDFGKTTNTFAKQYHDIYKDYTNQENLSYDMYPGWKGLDLPRLREGTYEAPDVKGAGGIEMDFSVPTTVTPTFGVKAPGIPEENYNYVKPPEVYSMGDAWKTMPEVPELIMSGKQGAESGGLTAKEAEAAEDAAFYTPGQVGTPIVPKEDKPGTMLSRGFDKAVTALGKGGLPGVGDMTKLIGNYLGMTSGIKTANEQRATDVTKTNVYKNAGEESQRLLDNAKKGIEISKAQAIVKANTNTRTGRKGARNSARGVNQMRAMDWLYDTALNQQVADITAGAAQQMSAIDIQKSGVAMNADQLKGQGEWQATMANDADKDAYYTALALGRKDFATGMQQTGKDLNDMKQNKVINNLLSQYGQWFKANADGSITGKGVASTETKTSKDKEIELTDSKGKKFKITQSQFDKLMNT
jgi:hypothetical protein